LDVATTPQPLHEEIPMPLSVGVFWDNQSVSTALNIPLSLEEFMLRPDRDDGQKEELIEGELIVSPAAKVWHLVTSLGMTSRVLSAVVRCRRQTWLRCP